MASGRVFSRPGDLPNWSFAPFVSPDFDAAQEIAAVPLAPGSFAINLTTITRDAAAGLGNNLAQIAPATPGAGALFMGTPEPTLGVVALSAGNRLGSMAADIAFVATVTPRPDAAAGPGAQSKAIATSAALALSTGGQVSAPAPISPRLDVTRTPTPTVPSPAIAVTSLAVAAPSLFSTPVATPVPVASSTFAATAAPTTAVGYLVLRISENAYRGDAQFNLFVDGAETGGPLTALANHAAGDSQQFTIAGQFTDGPHWVAVQFTNSLKGAAPGPSRALYVDGVALNGITSGQTAMLPANGTVTFNEGAVPSLNAITVNLSETAWHGDAEAFVAIDGKLQHGLQFITANHASGATEPLHFLLDLATGPHTLGLAFLNPAPSRALYLDSIDIAGQHLASLAATLTGGPKNFAFNVAPPSTTNGSLFVTGGVPQPIGLMPYLG